MLTNTKMIMNDILLNTPHISANMAVRGIFFRRGKAIFPEYFPGRKFPFGRPKTNFSPFEK